ncbi:unnamed protein product [Ceratitis capitata]|uniref:(Mediterranean fruit fly) hypothetical protein n=1 Tax=Ceratitis capitata TaxID=7213 RepID=A0A811UTS1_CERCA|nr:unnamed protein product [Ceratitis capitata]
MANSAKIVVGNQNATASAPTVTANNKQYRQQHSLLLLLFTLLQLCLALLVASSCLTLPAAANAKHLDGLHHFHAHHEHQQQLQQQQHEHGHHRRRLQRDSTSKILNTREQCNNVRDYFESIDIKLGSGNFEEKERTKSQREHARKSKAKRKKKHSKGSIYNTYVCE